MPHLLAAIGCVLALSCTINSTPSTTAAPPAPPRAGSPEGAPAVDYARLATDVITELNRVRTDPRGYAATLEALLPNYHGKLLRRPELAVAIETVEGAAAVREAIRVLRAQAPLPALARSEGLSRAARDHVRDQGPTGGTGHVGVDGSRTSERVDRYGKWDVTLTENIAYGPFTGAQDVVTDLLIDDGVPNRSHRRNILDPSIRVAGVACGPHRQFRSLCVIVHAGRFTEAATSRRRGG